MPTRETYIPGSPSRPFSAAVRVGDVLYLSGQLGTLPETDKLVPGGIEAETRQALENVKEVLARAGSSMDRVFKCTVMLADIGEWARMNVAYLECFGAHRPTRSAFGASGLALGARVEIECWAVAGESSGEYRPPIAPAPGLG
jgi:2-iminobutanoate/2-iminopropanoate deaminase